MTILKQLEWIVSSKHRYATIKFVYDINSKILKYPLPIVRPFLLPRLDARGHVEVAEVCRRQLSSEARDVFADVALDVRARQEVRRTLLQVKMLTSLRLF